MLFSSTLTLDWQLVQAVHISPITWNVVLNRGKVLKVELKIVTAAEIGFGCSCNEGISDLAAGSRHLFLPFLLVRLFAAFFTLVSNLTRHKPSLQHGAFLMAWIAVL